MPSKSPGPLRAGQSSAWSESCASVAAALGKAVDLALVHNERDVRGNQPRAALNPLTVLLAVSAWERLVADVGHLSVGGTWPGAGQVVAKPGAAYATNAFRLLSATTRARLPDAYRLTMFTGYAGKRPHGRFEQRGDTNGVLGRELDGWIAARNGVAHAVMPQVASRVTWRSDAAGGGPQKLAPGLTVQSGGARACLSLFIQLVDQTTTVVAASAGIDATRTTRLPAWWFVAIPRPGSRGIEEPGPLWGGHALTRL